MQRLLLDGAESIHFFAALAILHQDDLKNRMNSPDSLNHPGAKKLALQGMNQFCPPISSDDLCLLFCLYHRSKAIIWLLSPCSQSYHETWMFSSDL